jgi:hypothetical protein
LRKNVQKGLKTGGGSAGYRYLPQLRVAIQKEIERQTVKKDQMKEAA